MKNGKTVTLAIESSCDETAAAVLLDGREVLSNIISSQIDIHKLYGGVVPEIASRHHLTNVNTVVDQALDAAKVTMDEVDHYRCYLRPGACRSASHRSCYCKGLCAGSRETAGGGTSYPGSYLC